MDWTSVAVASIGAVAGIGGYVTSSRSARRASESSERIARLQAEQAAYERSVTFDVGLQQRMGAEITRQAGQIRTLERRVSALCQQLTDAGLVPVNPEEDP